MPRQTEEKSAEKRSRAGRPIKEINRVQFESLLKMQCTLAEITGFFSDQLGGCSEDTIERWCRRTYHENFADISKKFSSIGKISLRRYQFQLAEKSPAMAIFLGKNYLGQRDVIEQTSSGEPSTIEKIALSLIEQKNDRANNA